MGGCKLGIRTLSIVFYILMTRNNLLGVELGSELTFPFVKSVQAIYTVNVTGSVTLDCIVEGNSTDHVYWQKISNETFTNITIDGRKYNGSTVEMPSLTILDVDRMDEGSYICFAVIRNITGNSDLIVVDVLESFPFVKSVQAIYTVNVTGSVTLDCIVEGNSMDHVYWQKISNETFTNITIDGRKYNGSTVEMPSLTILDVDRMDEGSYICFAVIRNITGNSDLIVVDVLESEPDTPVLTGPLLVTAGVANTYKCRSVGGNPKPAMQMRYDTTEFQSNEITETANFLTSNNSWTLEQDARWTPITNGQVTIYCQIDHPQTRPDNPQIVSLVVTVNKPVSINAPQLTYTPTIGTTFTMVCTVTGIANTVRWFKNNSTTPINIGSNSRMSGGSVATPSLTISNAQESDSGQYVCQASDATKTVNTNTITVSAQSEPDTLVLTGPLVVTAGVANTYKCRSVGGNPKPAMQMRYDTTDFQSNEITETANFLTSDNSWTLEQDARWTPITNGQVTIYCQIDHPQTRPDNPQIVSLVVTVNEPVSINAPQLTYTPTIGTTFTMVCTVTGIANTVRWFKNNSTTPINIGSNSRMSGGSVATPSLTISNAQESDSGQYVCQASDATKTVNTNTITVSAQSLPTVTIQQPSYSTNYGNPVTLVCTVSAVPFQTRVNWRKDNNLVINSGDNGYSGSTPGNPSLTINNPTTKDQGQYRCYAENPVGNGISEVTTLTVIGGLLNVNIPQPSYSAILGTNSVTITCTVNGSPSANSVSWRKIQGGQSTNINIGSSYGKYQGGSVNNPSLTILNIAQSDEANYVCSASNIAGTSSSQQAFLDVTGTFPFVKSVQAIYTVNVTGSVTLDCIVEGNSTDHVYWQKISNETFTNITIDGRKYNGSTVEMPSLTILDVDRMDEGSYICFAVIRNITGNSDLIVVDVLESFPFVKSVQAIYTVNVTGSVTLDCIVEGNSTDHVYWQKISNNKTFTNITIDGRKYNGSTVEMPSLTILDVDRMDEGSYICFAVIRNITGNSDLIVVDVLESIPRISIPQNFYSAIFTQSVTLECQVNANPREDHVYWQRTQNNITIDGRKFYGSTVETPSLTIHNVDRTDEGFYTCYASNSIGTGSSDQTFLKVLQTFPFVKSVQAIYTVNVTGSVTLDCIVEGNSTDHVYWQKISNETFTNITIDGRKYNGSTVEMPSLTILDVDRMDEGSYICFAVIRNITGNSDLIVVDVLESIPRISIPQNFYSAIFTQSVTLECQVNANPREDHVYWQRTQNNITIDGRKFNGSTVETPSLTIHNVDRTDEGFYTCYASNSIGTGSSDQTFLKVLQTVPFVSVPQKSYAVNVTNSVTLECSVKAYPSEDHVYWQRNASNVITILTIDGRKYNGSTVEMPSLTILDVNRMDEGLYMCFAVNRNGTGSSDDIFVEVLETIPRISIPQNFYSANITQSVTLECQVAANPREDRVYWQRRLNNTETNITIDGRKYNGSTVETPSLTIHDVDRTDEGFYVCHASNSIGTGNSGYIFLDVLQAFPFVKSVQAIYTVNVTGSVTLDCIVEGNSTDHVYWQKISNNKTFTNITIDGRKYNGSTVEMPSLTILDVDRMDEGSYICFAVIRNITGNSDLIVVDVLESIPRISIPQNFYSANITQSVTLTCQVNANPREDHVYWQRTQNSITIDGRKFNGSTVETPSLTIHDVNRTDEGFYTCYASNSFGTGSSDQTFLTVLQTVPFVSVPQKSYAVNVTNSVTLECSVKAYPSEDRVVWQRNASNVVTTLTIDGRKYNGSTVEMPSLTIHDVDRTDEGLYTCYASNSIGTGSSDQTFLKVLQTVPFVSVPQKSYAVNVTNSVTLECSVKAYPLEDHVYWQRNASNVVTILTIDGRKYNGSTVKMPSLTILDVNRMDEGLYMCFAVNRNGTGSSDDIFVDVLETIPRISIPQNFYSANITQSVTLECQVAANPREDRVYWQRRLNNTETNITIDGRKYNGSTVETPSLTIHDVDRTDEGFYVCDASNSIGTGNSGYIFLDVLQAAPLVHIVEHQYIVEYGKSVTLECIVKAYPIEDIVYWQRVVNNIPTNLTIDGRKYGGSTVDTPSLTIYNAVRDDEEYYVCFASNYLGTGNSSRIYVQVFGGNPTASTLMFVLRILNHTFSDELEDRTSKKSIDLSNQIKANLKLVLQKLRGLISVNVLGFRKGSVLVVSELTLDESGEPGNASNILQSYVATGEIGNLQVDPRYYFSNYGDTNIEIVTLKSERPFTEDAMANITCIASIFGKIDANWTLNAKWTLNDSVIRPTLRSRYRTETVTVTDPFFFQRIFRLIIDPLLLRDTGLITCYVSDGHVHTAKSIDVQVIDKPVAAIVPLTKVLTQGEAVTVTCRLSSVYKIPAQATWYKDGHPFYGSINEVLSSDDSGLSYTLTSSDIQQSVVYGCEGLNFAGNGQKAYSNITVIDPKANVFYCPEEKDVYGILWERTVENVHVVQQCGVEYKVMQMFRPSRGGSRTRGKKSHSTRTWTVQFFCLADRKASKPPKTTEKVALQKAGLGLKKVQLKCTDDEEEVLSTLVSDVGFTQLKDIGGFELLHCQSNCRTLQLITCRWSVDELKKVIGVQAKIYIRPIQKNLIVRTLNQDGSSTSLKEQCTTCGESFSLAELRQHVTLCAKDESDDDIPYDDTAQEAIEIPNSVTPDDTAPEAIEIPNSVTTIIVHGSHETAQIIHVQDPTNQDISIIQNDDSLVSHVEETNIPEDIHVNQEETHYGTDNDIDALVKATVKYCQEKNMSDPVDILRFYRTKVVTGRKLDIEDPTEATEGETNFILVDRGRLLSSAIDEIEGITNLRLCLEVQFYGEESVDLGGPRKEFFVLALREMKEKYFNPIREWSKDYMSLGKIMALSILQNGKMPRVFPADIVQEVFCSDSEIARPVIEDIRKGLDALGIHQLTRKLTSLIHLFTPNAQLPITVRQLSHLLQPLFSPEGSNRRRIESAMFSNFVKYMREVASDASRTCKAGVWENLDYSKCVKTDLVDVFVKSDKLKDGVTAEEVNNILQSLNNITSANKGILTTGDLMLSSTTLLNIAGHAVERPETISTNQLQDFVLGANSLLAVNNTKSWTEAKNQNLGGISELAQAATVYTKVYAESQTTIFKETILADQMLVEVAKVETEDVIFPARFQESRDTWIDSSSSRLLLKKSSVMGQSMIGYSAVYYRNVSDLFPPYMLSNNQVRSIKGGLMVGSDVIDFSLVKAPYKMDPPLVIEFKYLQKDHSNTECVFWDFNLRGPSKGAWSTRGSKLTRTTDTTATCEYDHTTNFAILMSPGVAPGEHKQVLSIISIIGCAISLLFLIITVIVYFLMWRQVKSERAKILVNICVALIITYLIFLIGVPRTEVKEVCTTMAVLLHYILLVDFCLMQAMGVEISICVLYVMPTKTKSKWRIPVSWIVPVVIVAISMGATQLEGYGNAAICWLSTESGLIWAFAGPALLIAMINFVILVLVLRVMFKSMKTQQWKKETTEKSKADLAKKGFRSLCVLGPLFGLTWLFGALTFIDENIVAFQYLFAIFNSLQGLFIFLFHCLLDKKVRDGFKHHEKKRKSVQMESFSKTPKSKPNGKISKKKSQEGYDSNNDYSTTGNRKFSYTTEDFEVSASVQKSKQNDISVANPLQGDVTASPKEMPIGRPSPVLRGDSLGVDVGYNPFGNFSPGNRERQPALVDFDSIC